MSASSTYLGITGGWLKFHHGCSRSMGKAAEEPSGRPLPVPVGGAAGAAAEAEAAAEKPSGRPLPVGGGFGTADDEDAAPGVLKAGGRKGAREDAGGAFGAAAAADLETSRILLPDLAGCAGREPASGRPPSLDASNHAAAPDGGGREGFHGGGASPGAVFGGGMLSTSKEKAL